MTDFLTNDYWNSRYLTNNKGWDLGQISPPIKEYFDQVEEKNLRILIPGCGLAFEGEYLFKLGFENVFLMDFAEETKRLFLERVPAFPNENFLIGDFFKAQGTYDIIVEQTLFCAINPSLRPLYVQKVKELLGANGKLVGLLFNRDFEGGPPFGGNKEAYLELFSSEFDTVKMENCYNSILPRKDSELFINISNSKNLNKSH